MHPVIAYYVKMLVCSTVLLTYYWTALRNERFHQWNRFYLLGTLLLSTTLPFFNIPLLVQEEPPMVVNMVAALPWNQVVVTPAPFSWGWKEVMILVAALVSIALFLHLIISIIRIVRLYRSHVPSGYHDVQIVVTEEKAAPFSFFRWLFWRNDIDPDSENGYRMLQHELAHISERHSADKIWVELLLVVFWMNPVFWIIRRELYAIHEFLADQKAIARHDGAAFAAMILEAAHRSPTPALVHPFFTSHLKRRLQMITTSHEPKYSYLRRLSAGMLMVATAGILLISIEKAYSQDKKRMSPPVVVKDDPNMPDSILTVNVFQKKGINYAKFEMKDGRVLTMPLKDAKKKGYYIPPPPPPPPPSQPPPPPTQPIKENNTSTPQEPFLSEDFLKDNPLIIYAGLEISKEQLRSIKAEDIATIDVLKGDAALALYGDKAKNGVIKITPKNQDYSQHKSAAATVTGIRVHPKVSGMQPLVIVEGKRISKVEMSDINPSSIKAVNVVKGVPATTKYGKDGENGVIEIQLKPKDETTFDKVFTIVEQPPSFPGGLEAWNNYVSKNLSYPKEAASKGISGTVVVQFTIDEGGKIYNVKATNNPGGGLAEEAERIVRNSPTWYPGLQNDQKVPVRTSQVIKFQLQ